MAFFKHAGRADNCCEECKSSPCDPCQSCSENATLEVVISGVDGCACVSQGGSPEMWVKSVITGLNGSHTVTWNGSFWEKLLIGNVTTDYFFGPSQTCTGSASGGDHTSGPMRLIVSCSDFGYTVFEANWNVFTANAGPLGAALPNTLTCATFPNRGHGGTATVTE